MTPNDIAGELVRDETVEIITIHPTDGKGNILSSKEQVTIGWTALGEDAPLTAYEQERKAKL